MTPAAADLRSHLETFETWPSAVVEEVLIPASAQEVRDLLGYPQAWCERTPGVTSVDPVRGGFRVTAIGVTYTVTVDLETPDGFAGFYSGASLYGLRLPTPEQDAFWLELVSEGSAVRVRAGRASRFKGRIAQAAGRALMPLHRKTLRDALADARRAIAPGVSDDGRTPFVPLMAAEVDGPTLTKQDARQMSEHKLRAHKIAAMASGAGMASTISARRQLGQTAMKATLWHAERTVDRRHNELGCSQLERRNSGCRLTRTSSPGWGSRPSAGRLANSRRSSTAAETARS